MLSRMYFRGVKPVIVDSRLKWDQRRQNKKKRTSLNKEKNYAQTVNSKKQFLTSQRLSNYVTKMNQKINRQQVSKNLIQHHTMISKYSLNFVVPWFTTNDLVTVYLYRFRCLTKINSYTKVIEDLTKLIELQQKLHTEDDDEYHPIDEFLQLESLSPYYLFHVRGIYYLKLKQTENAIKDFSNCIQLKSNYAEAFYKRGVAYLAQGHYAIAVSDFSQSIALQGPSPSQNLSAIYMNRAYVQAEHLGNLDDAISDLYQALSVK